MCGGSDIYFIVRVTSLLEYPPKLLQGSFFSNKLPACTVCSWQRVVYFAWQSVAFANPSRIHEILYVNELFLLTFFFDHNLLSCHFFHPPRVGSQSSHGPLDVLWQFSHSRESISTAGNESFLRGSLKQRHSDHFVHLPPPHPYLYDDRLTLTTCHFVNLMLATQ